MNSDRLDVTKLSLLVTGLSARYFEFNSSWRNLWNGQESHICKLNSW